MKFGMVFNKDEQIFARDLAHLKQRLDGEELFTCAGMDCAVCPFVIEHKIDSDCKLEKLSDYMYEVLAAMSREGVDINA